MNPLKRSVLALLALLMGLQSAGCGLKLLSWDQEIAMGIESQPGMIDQFGGKVPSQELQDYTTGVGKTLLAGVDEKVPEDVPWEFTLLNSEVINAFALPGGKVFMTRGLSSELENEAEFAAVVGHEIGHVTARHGNKRISAQIGFNAAVLGAAVAVGVADKDSDLRKYGKYGVPAIAIGGNLIILKYGRDEELEADRLGVKYMVAAGYNPIGAKRVQELLLSKAGGGAPIEWLSTHPSGERRIEQVQALIDEKYPETQNNPDYKLYVDRYRAEFRDRLSALPPAPHPESSVRFALADPTTWCAHCAAAAAE